MLVAGLGLDPLRNAMQVKRVLADTPNNRAGVSWDCTVRTTTVEGVSADTTGVVTGVPGPGGHESYLLHGHLHRHFEFERVGWEEEREDKSGLT